MNLSFGALDHCLLCPHRCGANRNAGITGKCNCLNGYAINAVVVHRGEEPVISGGVGICNVFFSHCNLQCVYCQNHQISDNRLEMKEYGNPEIIIRQIRNHLDAGCRAVGFVSPSHQIPQMVRIIEALSGYSPKPIIVYNTNSYDSTQTLRSLEEIVDIYLPDIKYADTGLALKYSGVADYPEVSMRALREMVRQKGTTLRLDETGQAVSGVIVRHLVLPGHAENSHRVLENLAFDISPRLSISLMSQYFPAHFATNMLPINRHLSHEEYAGVCRKLEDLGFCNGWIQDAGSHDHYRPDFSRPDIFEN